MRSLIRFLTMFLVFAFVAIPVAAQQCKVCDGLGCKNATLTETGRITCTATPSSCTLSGSTCFAGGGGCECGAPGCDPCEITCNQPMLDVPVWDLVGVAIHPAPRERVEWVLVDSRVTSGADIR